jgi:hypothetical protein
VETLDFAPLTQLAQLLVAAGMSASVNPEDVNVPGAWVTCDNIRRLPVGGDIQLECVVYLVAAQGDYATSYDQLAELYNQATAAGVYPDGPVSTQGLVLPDNPQPYPALRVPVNLI